MIEVNGLWKRYGEILGVRDVNFAVPRGQILGLLGPNGAGKSTIMKMLTGFMPPSQGDALLDGFSILDSPLEVKRRVGYLPEHPPVYPELTVWEQLDFAASLKEVPRKERKAAVERAMELTQIGHHQSRLVGNLSKGYQQRVGLAQALVHQPPILILDEPTVGLDPGQILGVRELIRGLGGDHTVILSTHILPEVSLICDSIVILHQGRVAAHGTEEEIASSLEDKSPLRVRIEGPEAEISAALQELPEVHSVQPFPAAKERAGGSFSLLGGEPDAIARAVSQLAQEKAWPILELRPPEHRLEDVFLQITHSEVSP